MKNKELLLSGIVLLLFGIVYIASSSVPNTSLTALLFPISILALLFGAGFIIYFFAAIAIRKYVK